MRHFLTICFISLSCIPSSWAGPVTLIGHDPDDHGFVTEYATLMDNVRDNVTNGGEGILVIGSASGSTPGAWLAAIAAAISPTMSVTYVNDSNINTISFVDYAILFIPSDIGDTVGGITQTEYDNLNNRQSDITTFVNAGGGVFSLTPGEFTNPFQFIAGVSSVTILSVNPAGTLPSGSDYDNVSTTTSGSLLGITDSSIDGCCWHNVFLTYPSYFSVLATANESVAGDEAFNGEAAIIGGISVSIPTPSGRTRCLQ